MSGDSATEQEEQPGGAPAGGSPYADDAEAMAIVARMRQRTPRADPLSVLPDVHPARLPRHIAVIMDGNGRWARERGFPRIVGHRAGAASVRAVVKECGRLGVEQVTLYSFSSENWKRPKDEISALMELCIAYCDGERDVLRAENIRARVIGDRDGLPGGVRASINALEEATASCTGPTLCLAINYGARREIARAARRVAEDVAAGRLLPEDVDEEAIASRLDTAGMPDPDLLIRTAGELRLSNYLLWQISYAELYVSPLYWPEFGAEALRDAVRAFAARGRRYGGIAEDRAGV